MKRSRKSNRVSWAPGVNLCQVKLFSTDDCPSQTGMGPQGNLQVKPSWIMHSGPVESDDLPPGFETTRSVNGLKDKVCRMFQIKWKSPPKFAMRYEWHVAAGEESEEAEAQKCREMGVLEAVYPRLSAIPRCPSVTSLIEDEHYDDSLTPVIPLTPIEEEEAPAEVVQSDWTAPVNIPKILHSQVSQGPLPCGSPKSSKPDTPVVTQPDAPKPKPVQGMLPGIGADVAVAASAVLAALMKSKEQGSLIDTDLLVKILSDPKMVEKLLNEHGASANANTASTNAVSAPLPVSKSVKKPVTESISLACPKPAMVLTSMPLNRNMNHGSQGPSGVHITLSVPSKVHTVPLFGPKGLNPSVSLSTPHPSIAVPPRPVLNCKQSFLNAVPAQPNTLPKVQPPLSTTPIQPNPVPLPPFVAFKPNPGKDINYIKNLIREHGQEKQEIHDGIILQTDNNHNLLQNMNLAQNIRPVKLKTTIQKPCIYFSTAKGCRNGANCLYQHDTSFQWQTGSAVEVPNAKRMKLGGEITGRT